MVDLKALYNLVSDHFTLSDREAIQNIGIVFYDNYRSLMVTPPSKNFGIITALLENHIYALAVAQPVPGRIEVRK